jgi:hypothetical protein
VNGGELKIQNVDISGANDSGIEVTGDARVAIDKSHVHQNLGRGIAIMGEAVATIRLSQIDGNGRNLPAVQITSLKPSVIVANHLDAPGAAIWLPTPPSKELLEQNLFGTTPRPGKPRDVRTLGGTP